MTGEIINRVSNSDLITIDLADYAPTSAIKILDVKVEIVFEPIWTKDMMSEEARLELGML